MAKVNPYELYEEGGYVCVRRVKYPRFTGRVLYSENCIELTDVVLLDECTDVRYLEKKMRLAGEFLKHRHRR